MSAQPIEQVEQVEQVAIEPGPGQFFEDVDIPLDREELTLLREQRECLESDIEIEKLSFKDRELAYKTIIKELNKSLTALVKKIKGRVKPVSMLCYEEKHFDIQIVHIRRVDTGEIVRSREMTDKDRQIPLFTEEIAAKRKVRVRKSVAVKSSSPVTTTQENELPISPETQDLSEITVKHQADGNVLLDQANNVTQLEPATIENICQLHGVETVDDLNQQQLAEVLGLNIDEIEPASADTDPADRILAVLQTDGGFALHCDKGIKILSNWSARDYAKRFEVKSIIECSQEQLNYIYLSITTTPTTPAGLITIEMIPDRHNYLARVYLERDGQTRAVAAPAMEMIATNQIGIESQEDLLKLWEEASVKVAKKLSTEDLPLPEPTTVKKTRKPREPREKKNQPAKSAKPEPIKAHIDQFDGRINLDHGTTNIKFGYHITDQTVINIFGVGLKDLDQAQLAFLWNHWGKDDLTGLKYEQRIEPTILIEPRITINITADRRFSLTRGDETRVLPSDDIDPHISLFEQHEARFANITQEELQVIWNDNAPSTEPRIVHDIENDGRISLCRGNEVRILAADVTEQSIVARFQIGISSLTQPQLAHLWRAHRAEHSDYNDIQAVINGSGQLEISTLDRKLIVPGYEILPLCEQYKVDSISQLNQEQLVDIYCSWRPITTKLASDKPAKKQRGPRKNKTEMASQV